MIPIIILLLDGEVLFKLKISFAHPVDLYALMDLSGSMRSVKENLGRIAQQVADALTDKTQDYRLAYGSYRDKPRYPFGSSKLINPIAPGHFNFYQTNYYTRFCSILKP